MSGAGNDSAGKPLARGAARLVVALRWWIIAFWALATVGSLMFFPSLTGSSGGSGLKGILSADTPAVQTEQRSAELFGFPLIARTVVVQRDSHGLSPYAQARTVIRAAAVDSGKAGDVSPTLGALPITNTAGLFPGAAESNTTALTYLLFAPSTSVGARTRAAHRYAEQFFTERDHVVGVTGSAPAREEQGGIIREALPTVEVATLVAIMLIVGLSFGSLVAPVVTVITVGVAYVATFRVSGLLTQLFDLPSPDELKPVVVALLLGVVTDYVVFFCASLRDHDRADPHGSVHSASIAAVTRSGPIVLVAGVAVAVGTASLLAAQSPFFRALGPALAFTVVVGLLVAITLIPALIAVFGEWIFWPRGRATARGGRHVERGGGPYTWPRRLSTFWPRGVIDAIAGSRFTAWAVFGSCITGLLLAASGLGALQLGVSFVSALPRDAPVREAAISAQRGFAEGILSPTVLLVEGPKIGDRTQELRELGLVLAHQPGVAGVLGPGSLPLPVRDPLLVSRDKSAARYLLILDADPLGARAVTLIDAVQANLPELIDQSGLGGATYGLGGDTATASFLVHQTESDLLRIGVAAMLANFFMLLIFLRAVLASLLLLFTSVLSVGASLGLVTLLFSYLDPGQGLTFYVPFAAAVLLLAFGSDYNIFTVGHVWEAASDTGSLDQGVRTGSPPAVSAMTVAGLALAASFGLLALVPLAPFRQLALAVGLGIFIDVFVVRALLVLSMLILVGGVGTWPNRRVRNVRVRATPAVRDHGDATSATSA